MVENNDYELKVSSNRKDHKLTTTMQPDVNKVFEVEMSAILRVGKPKEIFGLINSEYTENSNRSTLIKSSTKANNNKNRIKRPITGRNLRKRYDSNQSNGKMTHLSYYKQTSLSNSSFKLSSFSSFYLSHILPFFSLTFLSILI